MAALALTRRLVCWAIVACIAAAAAPAWACNVPVFRYALERWPTAPYRAWVLHRGPMAEADLKAVERLRSAGALLDLGVIDLAAPASAAAAKEWQAYASATQPWLVVRYPETVSVPTDLVSEPLSAGRIELLLDSPARHTIARRIIDGEAVVFVLLESGNLAKDDAAAKLVESEAKRLEKTLQLPQLPQGQWGDPKYDAEGPPKLRLAFSVLRISRTDPAEQVFVSMLMGGRKLAELTGPAVFPIFGRGRLLCALPDDRITKDEIEDIGGFLVGPCSCIVKEQNPGVDLLMSVDWEGALAGQASAIPAAAPLPLPSTADLRSPGPLEARVHAIHSVFGLLDKALLAVGLGVIVTVLATVFFVIWKRSKQA